MGDVLRNLYEIFDEINYTRKTFENLSTYKVCQQAANKLCCPKLSQHVNLLAICNKLDEIEYQICYKVVLTTPVVLLYQGFYKIDNAVTIL